MSGRGRKVLQVQCPCCQAALEIDAALGAVLHFKPHEKPREIADLETAVERQRGEAARREEAFRKSVEDHKSRKELLDRKFDELFRKVKEDPDSLPLPQRDIDID
jgi:hypothetical protein